MIKVAVVGATGLVGEKILKILEEEGFSQNIELTLFVSRRSEGKHILVWGKEYELKKLTKLEASQKFDYVFFSAGDDVSKSFAKLFKKSGACVIDNSNAFRRLADVPLVVPEVNGNVLSKNSMLISNPNCSTIQLAVVLSKIANLAKIEKVIVSTYQSVSGAGREAIEDLKSNTNRVIKEGINENLVAKIGSLGKNGYSVEEDKIMFELKKILNENFSVLATAVRVPIPYCHGESVYAKLDRKLPLSKVKSALKCPEIILDETELSLPTKVAETNKTHVCRLRRGEEDELLFFVVADNLRRGAAYNAVEIFKLKEEINKK